MRSRGLDASSHGLLPELVVQCCSDYGPALGPCKLLMHDFAAGPEHPYYIKFVQGLE